MAAAASLSRVSFRKPVLAWSIAADDEERFRRITRRVLGTIALLALILPFIPRPSPEDQRAQQLPPAVARLLLERPTPPPPPPKPAQVAQADKPLADVTLPPKPVPEPPRRDERAPVPEARRPVPNKPPGEAIAQARRRASGVGLLAATSEIAAIAAAPAAVQLRQDIATGPGVGSGQGAGVGAGTEAGIPARAMITSTAGRGSGGLNTAAFSRDTGGGGLAGRATTIVEGYAGGGGGGGAGGGGSGGSGRAGAGGGAGAGAAAPGGTLTRSGSGKASRSIEEIKLVFERNKGAIYALYNRALREDSSLQGKVVVSLKIDPSGAVTDCRIVSSELKSEDLERKLVARIRQFDFGAKDVEPMVVSWPVDFLPS